MKHSLWPFLMLPVSSLAVSACSVLVAGTEIIELFVPALPPGWDGLSPIDLSLTWIDSEGRHRNMPVQAGTSVPVELARGRRQGILVEASYRGHALRPGGSVYPDDLQARAGLGFMGSERLLASWRGGWKASVARAIAEKDSPEGYDLGRLEALAAVRLPDPWVLDPQAMALLLLRGGFSAAMVALPSTSDHALPGKVRWVGESPFQAFNRSEPLSPAESVGPAAAENAEALDTASDTAALGPGLWHFFSPDLELLVGVFPDREAVVLLRNLSRLESLLREPALDFFEFLLEAGYAPFQASLVLEKPLFRILRRPLG
ncbi:MAG: hypothetical protein WCQ50_06235 [Spirochaetota bacterium]